MAKISYAKKRLQEWGAAVTECNPQSIEALKGDVLIWVSIYKDSDEVSSINVRRAGEQDDPMTDYCPGAWCNNIKGAIELAERMATW